jgi:diamine N-acetyltransferase
MVYLKGKKDPIGHAGIDDLDFDDKRGEIFFLIGDRKEQGKGYGKEIVKLLLKYGFKQLHFHSIFASAVIVNISSQKILERSGFRKIGVRRGYNLINGKFLDEVFYDITIDDYKREV